jgi:hypothetical protein
MAGLGFPLHRVLSRVCTGTKRMGEISSAVSFTLRFNVEGVAKPPSEVLILSDSGC